VLYFYVCLFTDTSGRPSPTRAIEYCAYFTKLLRKIGYMGRNEVKGDDLLYRFFNEVLPSEPELFDKIPRLLVLSMAVWFPKSVYQRMPVLLPWVLRDPTCRGKKSRGKRIIPDQWGAPSGDGYLRDDNSLVKGIPKSLGIRSEAYSFVNGRHLGTEFVAAHIWRENKTGTLASRIPELNTFVPNLVWLPSQVAKLSDREGSHVQTALKEVSWSIYHDLLLTGSAKTVADRSWSLLPKPAATNDVLEKELNWFVVTNRFMKTRRSKLSAVIDALEKLKAGEKVSQKLQPSRFRDGLSSVPPKAREKLLSDLRLHIPQGESSIEISVELD